MKFFLLLRVLLCGMFFFLHSLLIAEYLLVDVNYNDYEKKMYISPVSKNDNNSHLLFSIIQKYSWPACLANLDDITQEEKKELFNSQPYAEELFLRKKIQEIDKKYDIIFIPQILHDLIMVYAQSEKEAFKTKDKFHTLKFNSNIILNGLFSNPNSTIATVMDSYKLYNNNIKKHYFQAQKYLFHYLKSWFCIDVLRDYFIGKSLHNYINDDTSYYSNDDMDAIEPLEDTIEATLRDIIEDIFPELITLLQVASPLLGSQPKYEIFTQHQQTIVNAFMVIIEKECQAHKNNQALLYRGFSFFDAPYAYDDQQALTTINLIDLPFTKEQNNAIKFHSISYGNSFLAGINNDLTAMPLYYYLEGKNAYMLTIDKYRYVYDQAERLFFIAPLNSLGGLYGSGEFFHSRSRVCAGIKGLPERVGGIFNVHGFIDYTSLILFSGDSWKHVVHLMEYLNQQNIFFLPTLTSSSIVPKVSDTLPLDCNFSLDNMERAATFLRMRHSFSLFKQLTLPNLYDLENTYGSVIKESIYASPAHYPLFSILDDATLGKTIFNVNKIIKKQSTGKTKHVDVHTGDTIIVMGDLGGSIHILLRNLRRLHMLGYLSLSLRLVPGKHLVFLANQTQAYNYSIDVIHVILQLLLKNPEQVTFLRSLAKNYNTESYNIIDDLNNRYGKKAPLMLRMIQKGLMPHIPTSVIFDSNNTSLYCGDVNSNIQEDGCKFYIHSYSPQDVSFLDQHVFIGDGQKIGALENVVATKKILYEKNGYCLSMCGDTIYLPFGTKKPDDIMTLLTVGDTVDSWKIAPCHFSLTPHRNQHYMRISKQPVDTWNPALPLQGDNDCIYVSHTDKPYDQTLYQTYAYSSDLYKKLNRYSIYLERSFRLHEKNHNDILFLQSMINLAQKSAAVFPEQALHCMLHILQSIKNVRSPLVEDIVLTIITMIIEQIHNYIHVIHSEKILEKALHFTMKNIFSIKDENTRNAFLIRVFNFDYYKASILLEAFLGLCLNYDFKKSSLMIILNNMDVAHNKKNVIDFLHLSTASANAFSQKIMHMLYEKKETLMHKSESF